MGRTLTEACARLRPVAVASPYSSDERGSFAAQFMTLPAAPYFGLELDLSDTHIVVVRLPQLAPHHLGGVRTHAVNGAVLAALFDCALGIAGSLQFPAQRVGTVELSMQFRRPAFDAPLNALAYCTRRTSHVAFVAAEIYAGESLCAGATGMVARSSSSEPAIW
jgi:acyl-coenzyme A thioesterase PaaI-like protein